MSEIDGGAESRAVPLGQFPPGISVASSSDQGRFLDEYRPYLLTIAMAELPDALRGKLGASDLVQETILKGLKNFSTFKGSTRQEFAAWLRIILLNVVANCRKAYHAEKRDVAREVPLGPPVVATNLPSPSATTLTREQWSLLERALLRLSDEYREAILLRHRENLSFVEIGNRLRKSEDAARKTWTRAVKQLQQELQEYESGTT